MEALKELKDEGVIRAIGLGVRSHELHQRCIETGDFEVSLTHCDYNLVEQSAAEGVLAPAAAHGVGVLNGAAVLLGLLGGRDPREVAPRLGAFATAERVERACALWDWAQARGVNLLALNLQFCMREPRITSTLVGASNPAEIEADLAAATGSRARARTGTEGLRASAGVPDAPLGSVRTPSQRARCSGSANSHPPGSSSPTLRRRRCELHRAWLGPGA